MIDPIHAGENGGHGQDSLCCEQGYNGNKCFSFPPGFADFVEYLICAAAHSAACPSPSCPALASERERERCSYISMRRRTAPSTETSSWVSLPSSYYPSFLPSFLPGSFLFPPLALPLFASLSVPLHPFCSCDFSEAGFN